jgi:hypothetical protein
LRYLKWEFRCSQIAIGWMRHKTQGRRKLCGRDASDMIADYFRVDETYSRKISSQQFHYGNRISLKLLRFLTSGIQVCMKYA